MELIILGHIIGDFYLQTNLIAIKKKESLKFLALHCLLYCIPVITGAVIVGDSSIKKYFLFSLLLFLTHFVIDKMKNDFDKRGHYVGIIFLLDQVVHIAILVILLSVLHIDIDNTNSLIYNYLEKKELIAMAAILVCWKPAAIFISVIFESLFLKKKDEESEKVAGKKEETNDGQEHQENVRVGYWIGVLEREIILVLGLLGQYGAIGFVLTAKSLARYKQLELQEFAEKYLVGTLMSAFIAFCCLFICNKYK